MASDRLYRYNVVNMVFSLSTVDTLVLLLDVVSKLSLGRRIRHEDRKLRIQTIIFNLNVYTKPANAWEKK